MVRAEEGILRKLLEGEKQYRIPLYQRPYQWGKSQWQTLWDDIFDHVESDDEENSSSHFIGSMVLVPITDTHSAMGVAQFLVVDGQQRLTTLILMLAAIRDYKHHQQDEAGAKKINNQFLVNEYQEGDQYLKLVPTQLNRSDFADIMHRRPSGGGDGNIGDAYRFFRSKLELLKPGEATGIESFILNGLSIVSITTHKEDNVHRIFQSLNNTGLQLTQGDLIRNLIFMRLGDRGDDVYSNYWLPMEETLPTNSALESLFWLDLLKQFPTLKQDETFTAYQRRLDGFTSQDDLVDEVKRIAELVKIYAIILQPTSEPDSQVRERLERLHAWKGTTPHSLMLEILLRRQTGEASSDEVANALLVIESFLVRRLVVGQSSQTLNRVFPQALNQLRHDEPIDAQVQRLLSTGRKHFATDREITQAVVNSPFFLKGRREHKSVFLAWLEESFESKEPVNTTNSSIEHVMPQTLSVAWVKELISRYGNDNYLDEYNATVHTLGNLTLSGYNSALSNRPFSEKRLEYAKTGIRLSADLLRYDFFGPDEIRNRSARLAARIISTWPGPTEDQAEDAEASPLWRKVHAIIATIPPGHWASYGDIASAVGTRAQPVGNHLATNPVLGGHRVMRSDGAVSANFSWLDDNEARTAREVLESEGLQFTGSGKADPHARLSVAQLLDLVEIDEES